MLLRQRSVVTIRINLKRKTQQSPQTSKLILKKKKISQAKVAEKNIKLVRPLLSFTRREIEEFIKAENIPYRVDASNESVDYTRNSIRHELLPMLREKYNVRVDDSLGQLGQTAGWLNALLKEGADCDLQELTLKQEKDYWELDLTALAVKEKIQQGEIVHKVLSVLELPQRKIGFRQIKAVLSMTEPDSKDRVVQLPYGLEVIKQGTRLIFRLGQGESREKLKVKHKEITLPEAGEVLLEGWMGVESGTGRIKELHKLQCEPIEKENSGGETFYHNKNVWQEIIDADKIKGRLQVRSRRVGERFGPLGQAGSKKLGDFFTDAKVDEEHRDRVGLVCDEEGIVWVMGLRISERVKVTEKTRRMFKLSIIKK